MVSIRRSFIVCCKKFNRYSSVNVRLFFITVVKLLRTFIDLAFSPTFLGVETPD
jgi:hypothetical protein